MMKRANDAPAVNEIEYMINNNNQVSYHVAVDDKEIIQAIPFNRNAWHCGEGGGSTDPNALKKGNRLSIGIEICFSKGGGARYAVAEENAVQYIAKLLKQTVRALRE
ncbi:N-acetylmuramoyl-L-alanine amidase [Lysinibacillus capsici]|uniref:N-acetylmuramoyl-L-alanine amidase n=1 Tax=Lysinibacillus capsici TaxID=2115968 RepID=A0A2X0XP64_9BACI|nr:N-acetylmuramoyl-L-alanine amidase [Lysinibacillus capsici]